jgi:uncharacterized protein involved in exopolysaccharide biosynthesis/Mrp family chromosome partitioning ATPase
MQSSDTLTFLPGTRKTKPFDIVKFVKQYILIVLILGNFGFTLLAPFALMSIKPYYEASAMLQIDPVVQTIIGGGHEASIQNQYTDYMRTQTMRLREISLLRQAISQLNLKAKNAFFPTDMSDEKRARLLNEKLYIDWIPRSHVIELALKGPHAKGLADILNAVMQTYKDSVDKKQEQQNEKRLIYLENESNMLKQKINTKSKQLKQIIQKTSTSTFNESFNLSYRRIEQLQDAYIDIHLQKIDAETEYQKRLQENKEITQLSMSPQIEDFVANDWGLDSTQSWTYKKLQELRSGLYGLSENNKDREHIVQRMGAMKDYEQKINDEVREHAHEILYGKRQYDLDKQLIQAKSRLKALQKSEQTIQSKLNIAKKRAAQLSQAMVDGEEIQAELQQMRNRYFKVVSRISDLEVQGKAPSRVSIQSMAREPQEQAGSNAKKLFLVSVAFPFGAISLFLFMFEYLDKRVTSAKHIVQALGSPPSWPISRAPSGVKFHRVVLDAPNTVTAKAIRSLSQRIFKDAEENKSQVFLFTGVEHQCGVTEILLNTATLLGKMIPKILVLETNAFHANMRQLLALTDAHPGLNEYLSSNDQLEDCIYTEQERKIDIIFSGGVGVQDIATLRFREVISELKKKYDLILIDSDPIMKSDLTEFLVMFTDVSFLFVQGDRTLCPDLRFSAELFVRAQVPALGSVLNWGGPVPTSRIEEILERFQMTSLLKRYRQYLQKVSGKERV